MRAHVLAVAVAVACLCVPSLGAAQQGQTIQFRASEVRSIAEIPGQVEDPYVLRIVLSTGRTYEIETDVGSAPCVAMIESARRDAASGLDWNIAISSTADAQTMNGVAITACGIQARLGG